MSRALYTAATGMHAQQLKIDVIANNLANVNTDGFKQKRLEFQDLVYQNLRVAGASTDFSASAPAGLQVGLGVKSAATVHNFDQGAMRVTTNELDMAIAGEGFFRVRDGNGQIHYTRTGNFQINDRNELVTANGYSLEPPIILPRDTEAGTLNVDANGRVSVKSNTDNTRSIEVGTIQLSKLLNQGSMESMGSNLFRYSGTDRSLVTGVPGDDGFGSIVQKTLETSNVKVVEEMVAMIRGQRAYEANSKVIQAADRMLEEANRLR